MADEKTVKETSYVSKEGVKESQVKKTKHGRNEDGSVMSPSQFIKQLHRENRELRDETNRILADINAEVEKRVRETIISKEAYITRVEQDYEDKIANKELVIKGLQDQIASLTKEQQSVSGGLLSRIKKFFYGC